MKTITAILVDDEISNLKGLERKLEHLFPEIDIIHSFQSPEEAIEGIKNTPPDILFLDIEMPRINGFQLLTQLKEIAFKTIFVTAYNTYAIEAFKQNALDYILKPIDNDELKLAVNKAVHIVREEELQTHNKKLIHVLTDKVKGLNKIIVPTVKGISFYKPEEVIRLEGKEGYTYVYLKTGDKVLSSYSIGKYEKQLNSEGFFQCHRSHIVNIEFITDFLNEGYVLLNNTHKVPISKAKRKQFLNLYLN